MLIGHLPVGYFLTRFLVKKVKLPLNKLWLGLGLAAAVAPDFDHAFNLFFQTTIYDHRSLITHVPLTYVIAALIGFIAYKIRPWPWLKWGMIIILPNAFLHTVLDTPFIGIKWLWPFSNQLFGIYNVNLTQGIIVENYFQHWYWYLEIALWILAVCHVIYSHNKGELK